MTISTVLSALCSGAFKDDGKRDAAAVSAGAAVPPALGVAVSVFESVGVAIVWVLGADIDAVPLGWGVRKGVLVELELTAEVDMGLW